LVAAFPPVAVGAVVHTLAVQILYTFHFWKRVFEACRQKHLAGVVYVSFAGFYHIGAFAVGGSGYWAVYYLNAVFLKFFTTFFYKIARVYTIAGQEAIHASRPAVAGLTAV